MGGKKKLDLHSPHLLAAWPGMGLVGYKTIDYLINNLPAELIEEVELEGYTALRGVQVEAGLVQPVSFPKGRLYACRGDHDLLLYQGDEQPLSGQEWPYMNSFLDQMDRFGVRRVYTFAAMVLDTDHQSEPKVWCCATDDELLHELALHDVQIMRDGTISGLNGLLLGAAKRRGLSGCCMLGETPLYMTQIEYFKSSAAIVRRLIDIFSLEGVDREELTTLSRASSAQIDVLIKQVRKTMQSQEGEGEEDDEGGGSGSGSGGEIN